MCLYCHEALGLSCLAGALGRGPPREDFRVAWTVPFLVQEGMLNPRSPEAEALAPVSSRCVDLERKAAKTSARDRAASAGEAALLVKQKAIQDYLDLLTSIDKAALLVQQKAIQDALDLNTSFGTQRSATETASIAVLAAFPDAWAAWLIVRSHPDIRQRVRLAQALACTGIAITDEMLELWLQRSAALTWHDAAGFKPLLAAYGTRCRRAVVHYVALRRQITSKDASSLRDLAFKYGEVESAEWLAEQLRSE